MSSISDFLFNGEQPQSLTGYTSSTTNIPQYLNDFQQGILAKGNEIASQPYEPYGGARIADFNAEQNSAFGAIKAGQGAESGAMHTAMGDAASAGENANASGAAAPWLQRAGQQSYDTVGKYMNPYNDAVTNRISVLGARNLNENLMPAINSDFIRAGQYGSTGQMKEIGNALRDTSDGILAEQDKALQSGYNTALGAAQSDASLAGQIGQTTGNLSNMDSVMQLNGAKGAGALGSMAQDARYKDSSALSGIGDAKQAMTQKNLDLAQQDFVDQRDYQKNQLNYLSNLTHGFQVPTSTSITRTEPGGTIGTSPVANALSSAINATNLLK